MLKATIYNLDFFEQFLSIVNKFVQQCRFELSTKELNVYCLNRQVFPSSRLLLNTNVIKLNENQEVDLINICVRDVVALKSALSIVSQLEDAEGIEIGLDTVKYDNELLVKSIKYKSKKGSNFNLITIDYDVIKDLVTKDVVNNYDENWSFNINPIMLDIVQNKTSNIVNLDQVSIYIYPREENGPAIVNLASKKTSALNSITIPISDNSVGSLNGFKYEVNGIVIYPKEVAVHESAFRIFNILKTQDSADIHCSFNFASKFFYIKSKLKNDQYEINSRLYVGIANGK